MKKDEGGRRGEADRREEEKATKASGPLARETPTAAPLAHATQLPETSSRHGDEAQRDWPERSAGRRQNSANLEEDRPPTLRSSPGCLPASLPLTPANPLGVSRYY